MKRLRSLFWGALGLLSWAIMAGPATVAAADSASVLVFGGTGRLGSEVVKALLEDNHRVTVFARPSSARERLEGLPVSFVVGDVLDSGQVTQRVAEASPDVIVDALGRGDAPVSFYADSARNIAQAAAAAGVQQLILHGSVGAGDSAAAYPSGRLSRMQKLFEAKTAGENAVRDSGVTFTIIRHLRLLRHGAGPSDGLELVADETVGGTVSRADLGAVTRQCVLQERCYNQILHARSDR